MNKKTNKTKGIRVATIGYGGRWNMGGAHMKQMVAAGMTPIAVAELDKERLRQAEREYPGIQTFASVGALLKRACPDLVTIITPHNTHAKLALQCLRSGAHVVCEKPFAITTRECDRIIAEARRQKRLVSAYHNRHWDGCVLQALKVIRRGSIGNVLRMEVNMTKRGCPQDTWRGSKSLSGGILYDWGVHLLEYGLQIMDSEMVEVTGFSSSGFWQDRCAWKEDTNEDEATMVVRFRSGAFLMMTISNLDPGPSPHLVRVVGTEGVYGFNMNDYALTTVSAGRTVVRSGSNPPAQWDRYYANVAGHLSGSEELVITPEYARRPIHALELAGRSANLGKSIRTHHA